MKVLTKSIINTTLVYFDLEHAFRDYATLSLLKFISSLNLLPALLKDLTRLEPMHVNH